MTTRRSNDLRLPPPRTNWGKQTFIYQAAKDWNSLPTDLKKTHFLFIFKSKLKTFLKDFLNTIYFNFIFIISLIKVIN